MRKSHARAVVSRADTPLPAAREMVTGASVLSQQQVDEIAARFKARFGVEPEAIYLVGSHAEGRATPLSDVDIVLETNIPGLNKFTGPGFEFFKDINPGRVPSGVTGIGGPGQPCISNLPG